MALTQKILQLIRCPKCKGELLYFESENNLVCKACSLNYQIEDDIPLLVFAEGHVENHKM